MTTQTKNSNRIQQTFEHLETQGKAALIPYIMAGDPSLDVTQSLILTLEKAGADLIELGVPFSDPIADGPVIQKAAERALKAGTTLSAILKMVHTIRKQSSIPLILMTYYNSIMAMGEKTFCAQAVEAGIDGVIVPDMPPEESDTLCRASSLAGGPIPIFLLAPTSTQSRQVEVITRTKGFIYYVSIAGITGAKLRDMTSVKKNVKKIQKAAKKPVAVGFGISTPQQVHDVSGFANGVIIGSALVRYVDQFHSGEKSLKSIAQFVKSLKNGIS